MRRRIDVAESVTEVRGMLSWGLPKNHQQRSVPVPRSWSTPWPSSSPERQNSSSPPARRCETWTFAATSSIERRSWPTGWRLLRLVCPQRAARTL